MCNLVSVEFSPVQEDSQIQCLAGCLGETLREVLQKAALRVKKNRAKADIKVPVRFPLAVPGGKISLELNRQSPCSLETLKDESLLLPLSSLYLSQKKPISLYEKRKYPGIKGLDRLIESPIYYQLAGKNKILNLFTDLRKKYTNVFVWKQESKTKVSAPSLLLEARLYGLDTIISIYDPAKINGIVLEITSRPWPLKEEYKMGIRVRRLQYDTFLFSSEQDYTNYLDGVYLNRTHTSVETLIEKYSKYAAVTEAKKIRNTLNKNNKFKQK